MTQRSPDLPSDVGFPLKDGKSSFGWSRAEVARAGQGVLTRLREQWSRLYTDASAGTRAVALLSAVPLVVACGRDAEPARDSARAFAAVAIAQTAASPPTNPDPATTTYAPTLGVTLATFTRRPSGMYVRNDVVGRGAVATIGREVRVRYTGALPDGTVFDSSHASGPPFAFVLGRGDVVKGWDEGMAGMRVGGTRTLIVPPALGFGAGSVPGIPPNAVLVFRVTLVGVELTGVRRSPRHG